MRHPVVRLSFGSGNFKEPGEVHARTMEQLAAAEGGAPVASDYTAPGRLARLLRAMAPDPSRQLTQGVRLRELLAANDFEGLEERRAWLSAIPHDWRRGNELARYEGFYASVFCSHFAAAGLDVAVEDASSHGQVMAVRFNGHVYLLEFKVVESAPDWAAMAQLKDRRYADKYRARGEPIDLIGGVQPRGPQPRRVRGGARLTGAASTSKGPARSRSRHPRLGRGALDEPVRIEGNGVRRAYPTVVAAFKPAKSFGRPGKGRHRRWWRRSTARDRALPLLPLLPS